MPASSTVDPLWWRTGQAEADPKMAQLLQHSEYHLRRSGEVVGYPSTRVERRRIERLAQRARPLALCDGLSLIERVAYG